MLSTESNMEPDFGSAAANALFKYARGRYQGQQIKPQALIEQAQADSQFSEAWLAYAIGSNSHPHELALAFACAQLHQFESLSFLQSFWAEAGRTAPLSVQDARAEYTRVTAEFALPTAITDSLLLAWIGICAQSTAALGHQVFEDEISLTDSKMSAQALTALQDYARDKLQVTRVYDDEGQPIENSTIRNNDQCMTILPRTEVELACIERYMAHMYKIPVGHAESIIIYRYTKGQEYKWHYDFITAQGQATGDELQLLGQRFRTSILYLSDGFEGGETEFKHSGLSLKGKPAEVVSFINMTAEARVNKRSLHRGSPVTSGEKWIATVWFRTRVNWLRTGLLF